MAAEVTAGATAGADGAAECRVRAHKPRRQGRAPGGRPSAVEHPSAAGRPGRAYLFLTLLSVGLGIGRDALAANPPADLPLVVLDPGHGGTDTGPKGTGARGICGVWEKDVALAVAIRSAEVLEASGLVRVQLTRSTDVTLALPARVAAANAAKAAVFVSVHANASPSPDVEGIETFFVSPHAGERDLLRLARRENDGVLPPANMRRKTLDKVLADLQRDDLLGRSQQLAIELQRGLASSLHARGRGVLQAPFVVLMGTEMPAALAEVGFVTHPAECLRLRGPLGQDRVAVALAGGILAFVAQDVERKAERKP